MQVLKMSMAFGAKNGIDGDGGDDDDVDDDDCAGAGMLFLQLFGFSTSDRVLSAVDRGVFV